MPTARRRQLPRVADASPTTERSRELDPSASRRARGVRIRRVWPIGFIARGCGPGGRCPYRRRQVAQTGRTTILAQINSSPLDAARVGVEHFGLERLRPGDEFATDRHMAGFGDEVAAERIDLLRDLTDV